MPTAEPLVQYGAFRRYRIPVRVAREACARHGVPRPRRISRLRRGEVNALFRLEFEESSPLILKVWVRPSGPELMKLHVHTVSRICEDAGIPTPGWRCISPGDDLIPYPYAAFEYVDGEDGDVLWRRISAEQKRGLLAQCANIMLTLHSSDIHAPGPSDAEAWAADETDGFRRCLQDLRRDEWLEHRTLDTIERAWDGRAASLADAGRLSIVHYDLQLHNLRVDPVSLEIKSLLDFDSVTRAPPFTDARDLMLSVFLREPGLGEAFWQEYGEPDEGRKAILALHALGRLLSILAAYGGPTPLGALA